MMRQAAEARQPLPPVLANKPELGMGLDFYLAAYYDLSSCRPPGISGLGAVPWTAIRDYARDLQLGDLDTYLLTLYVRGLERTHDEFLKSQADNLPHTARDNAGRQQTKKSIPAR